MHLNFRVWDTTQKTMVYFNFADIRRAQFLDKPSYQYVWPLNPENVFLKKTQITETESPVMLGSGLNDVNGKEIFEGDILECEDIKCEVVSFDGAFWAEFLSGKFAGETTLLCMLEGKIIGNIYENP